MKHPLYRSVGNGVVNIIITRSVLSANTRKTELMRNYSTKKPQRISASTIDIPRIQRSLGSITRLC